jgi:penicillin amidase
MLANDMHLGIRVPNTWYRATLRWPDPATTDRMEWVCGVTLPGVPAVVAGSNGSVAWGFTNSYGDWVDLVELEVDPSNPDIYLTPDGSERFEYYGETIEVSSGESFELEVKQTIWGPVIDQDHEGKLRALRWTAHDSRSVNMRLGGLVSASTVEQAIDVANRAGVPPQNFVCADSRGSIAWTIAGQIPRREGYSGRLPTSWSDGKNSWSGWLSPEEYPRIVNPADGRIWTANARVVDGEALAKIGDGGYALGARAQQIKKNLFKHESFTEETMLQIQLDDQALFLVRWRELLLEILDDEALASENHHRELRAIVDGWDGRASVESVGYRMVRAYRSFLSGSVLETLTATAPAVDERFRHGHLWQTEGAVWRIVTERPTHLLAPEYDSWEELLLAEVDHVIDYFTEDGANLGDHSWGKRNTARIRHPLSSALPILGKWLDMPAEPLPGDSNMPRVQSPTFGASERFVVSPGHEETGIFHMPCGQSGHPLSPFYRAGHEAWVTGTPTPFLPGETLYTLVLRPTLVSTPR